MKNLLPLALFTLLAACNLDKVEDGGGPGGTPLPTFERHFIVENGNDVTIHSVAEAIGGGYVVSGEQRQNGTTNLVGCFVAKTDKDGIVLKKLTDFTNFGLNSGGKLLKATDAYYLIGTEYTNKYQVLVSKIKPDLSVVWTKTYGNPQLSEFGEDIALSTSGDLIVCASGDKDPFFLKIRASDGVMLDSQTVDITNNGIFYPASMTKTGNAYTIMGYNFGISIAIPFVMKVDENFNTIIPYKGLQDAGNGTGEIFTDGSDGFVVIDGASTQLERQAFVVKLNGNGDKTARFDQRTDLPETGFLGGSRSNSGKYLACGWAAQVLGDDSFGIATLLGSDLSTEHDYEYKAPGLFIEFTAAAPVSDGGYVLAGAYNNGKELLLVRLNDKLSMN
jgi:hypothetical protein